MTTLSRRTFVLSGLAAPLVGCGSGAGSEWQGELSRYTVRDPMVGYFDRQARRTLLRNTRDPVLKKARRRIEQKVPACNQALAIPIQDHYIDLPSFYGENARWRVAVAPFRDFEDAVSNLAGAQLLTGDRRYADCLVSLLTNWAQRNALFEFSYNSKQKQGWYQVESTLFAIGFAIDVVRPDIPDREPELAYILQWLVGVARKHFDKRGEPGGTCCNNHFYRRCVYAAILGVLARDDRLFRDGLSALYSALSHPTPEGALPLEMEREELAAHYQNYAVMYLAMIAEIAERQGYPMWSLEVDGMTLHKLIEVNNRIIADPNYVTRFSGFPEVSLKYRKDNQYFSWFEMYLARYQNPQMEAWIAGRRPLYNRSLGGHMTAYFYTPPGGGLRPPTPTGAGGPGQPRWVEVPDAGGGVPTYRLEY